MEAQEKAQEIFNTVKTHLLKQNEKSGRVASNGKFMCEYRGPRGLQCAFSPLIPNDLYNSDMENENALVVIGRLSNRGYEDLDHHTDLCCCLQSIHDDTEPSEWESGLRLIAEEHDLEWGKE